MSASPRRSSLPSAVLLLAPGVLGAGETLSPSGGETSSLPFSPVCYAVGGVALVILVGALLLRWQVGVKTRALAESRHQVELLVESIPQGIVVADSEGRIVSVNPAAEKILGRSGGAGGSGEGIPIEQLAIVRVLQTSEPVYGEEQTVTRPDGQEVILSVSTVAIPDQDGKVRRVIASFADITEQKRSGEALKESEQRFRRMFETMTEGVALHHLVEDDTGRPIDYRIEAVNPAYAAHTGIERERAVGTLASELYGTGEPPLFDIFSRVAITGEPVRFDFAFAPLGRHFDISVFALDKQRFVTVFQDITERKQADDELRKAEQEKATIVNSVSEHLVYYDKDMRILWANRAAAESIGQPMDAIKGRTCYDLWKGRAALCPECPVVDSWTSGRPEQAELTSPDGRVWFVRGYPVLDAEGAVEGVVEVTQEITERKQAEMQLAAEKERLAVTLQSIGDGVITTDTDGQVLLMSRVAERLTGWSQDEAAGRPLREIFHIVREKTRERIESPVEQVLAGGAVVGLVRSMVLIARDGTRRIVADSAAPILGHDGKTMGVVLVFRDVSERRMMEEEMARAEVLESLGLLAGGIAHDFNNILTSILGNIFLSRTFVGEKSKAAARLTEAERASLRARDLTRQLLTFAKGGAPVKTMASLRDLIIESASFALRGSNVRCAYDLPDNLWPAEVDQGQISQVIQNLVINADQAMPDGGVIEISAENVSLRESLPRAYPELAAPAYVKIRIQDHGHGIPDEHLARIFDPFFTTKHKGSGLGLATSFSIAKRHEGHIAVTSELGIGTQFSLHLPAAPERLARATSQEEQAIPGTGRVLVMDDDDAILDLMEAMLPHLGYEGTFVHDGAEALAGYREAKEKGTPFDVVILDLTVPGGMGGKETIGKLRAFDPKVSAIVSSGYSTDPVMANAAEYGFKAGIAKPYNLVDLSKVLDCVLRGEV